MGCPAAARSVPSRFRHAPSDLRPRRDIQRSGSHNGESPRPAPSKDGLQKPLAERCRQSAGSEACVANCSITPSSSTSVTFADWWESTLPTTIRTARTTRLKRRLPAVVFPLPRREPALRSCSQAAGRSASPVPLGCVEAWADRFWRATPSSSERSIFGKRQNADARDGVARSVLTPF